MTNPLAVVEDAVQRHLLPRIASADAMSPMFRDILTSNNSSAAGVDVPLAAILRDYCVEHEIWPDNIAACLALIRTGWCMLHTGSPVFMMGYSATRDRYIASADAEIPHGWRDLSESKATLLLLLLASEEHDLPEHADAWGVVHFRDRMLFDFDSQNSTSVATYRDYLIGNRNELNTYELKLAHTFSQIRDYMRL
jgi:hypothetical protein